MVSSPPGGSVEAGGRAGECVSSTKLPSPPFSRRRGHGLASKRGHSPPELADPHEMGELLLVALLARLEEQRNKSYKKAGGRGDERTQSAKKRRGFIVRVVGEQQQNSTARRTQG